MQVGTSCSSTVSSGTDYAFILFPRPGIDLGAWRDPNGTGSGQEPTYCVGYGFDRLTLRSVRSAAEASPFGSVVTGSYPLLGRGLPTALPAIRLSVRPMKSSLTTSLGANASRVGLRRYEWVFVWSHLHTGQVLRQSKMPPDWRLVLPDKEFRSCCSPRRHGAWTISSTHASV